tara:strand:+ start:305 stop:700 length:396 start_codon:yes stop_codon:yes gene_type:complete
MKTFLTILVILFSFSVLARDDLTGKKILCAKLFWGFDFLSPNKVNVIITDINQKTYVNEYFYENDSKLSYINLYLNQENLKNKTFSIHNKTLRVDIWTMTSGGNTTREIIPVGFCKEVKVKNLKDYIKDLK